MMLKLLILLINFGFLHAISLQIGVQGKEARLDRFSGICPKYANAPIIYNYSNLRSIGNKVILNCSLTVKEDIHSNDIKMVTQIQRCKSGESLDSCENFHKFQVDNYCYDVEHSEMWKSFYADFKPKWKCPIKKGIYVSNKSEFDVGAFLMFPVDGWFWKLRSELRDVKTNRILMCMIAEAKVAFKNTP